MGFWGGIIIGTFLGANLGLIFGCVIAASRRRENSQEFLWNQSNVEMAVMDEAVVDDAVIDGRCPDNRLFSRCNKSSQAIPTPSSQV